jgi:putative SOS response-associated peptidase YedK
MCNLYSITTNQSAIAALFRVMNRYVGNLPPMPGVFPDYPAPVVRNAGADRELVLMRWGMPAPPRTGGPPVTNIRNTSSPHWRGWLKPENRCLVPFNSFAEYAPEPNPETKKKDVVWFAITDDRPLTCFAGIWTEFKGDRGTKSKPIPGPHNVYGFLTTAPNAVANRFTQRRCRSSCSRRKNATYGCARHGTRPRRCSGPCPTRRSRSSCGAPTRKIGPRLSSVLGRDPPERKFSIAARRMVAAHSRAPEPMPRWSLPGRPTWDFFGGAGLPKLEQPFLTSLDITSLAVADFLNDLRLSLVNRSESSSRRVSGF